MVTAIVRIKTHEYYTPIVPIVIPELDEVRKFAARLHDERKPWKGKAFGWTTEYNPERLESPLDSMMNFTPADFCIGESDIWFFSLMWEHGRNAEPVEFLDDKSILADYCQPVS
ncbi:MAG: hypothetical protein ABH886_07540 [Candidatus Desantisbacteria bacterium]